MRFDTQIGALYKATILGLQKMEYYIDPNGSDGNMAEKLSIDYNLPILGDKVNNRKRNGTRGGRIKGRFSFRDHMRLAFKAGIFGHYYFEQVGQIGPDGLWHMRKLAERPPWTIQDFRVADDGGLISIIQNVTTGGWGAWGQLPEIPIDRLVGYVWDKEGANWAGHSWFRECYKNWLIKDRLMRVDAVNHERAGGVPYIEAHPGATDTELDRLNMMAQGFRVGDTSGGAVPAGAKFQIARGTNSSVIESIKYHDEAMARLFMLMVMQLGQTKVGSRALGSTFVDFWGGGLESIAWWFCDTFNAYVLEDDIDWNYGEDVEKVPMLVFEFDPELVIHDLVELIQAKAIVVDDDLEAALRKELGLPDKGKPRPDPVLAAPPAAPGPVKPGAVSPATPSPTGGKTQVAAAAELEGAPSRAEPSPPLSKTGMEEWYGAEAITG